MKKYFSFIALALCAVLAISCGNNRSAKNSKGKLGKTEVAEAEIKLADNVLASIDSLAEAYGQIDAESAVEVILSRLTEEQKLVKPDYLLDPSLTKDLLSHRQRVNALAILVTERPVRVAYDMPVEEVDKAIASLAAYLNHPLSFLDIDTLTVSQKIKMTYESCREESMQCYFWQFNAAIQSNIFYLISCNCDRFFDNVTPEQYKAFTSRFLTTRKAAYELSEYDPEIASALAFQEKNWGFASVEEAEAALSDIETGRKTFKERKDDYRKYREWALL